MTYDPSHRNRPPRQGRWPQATPPEAWQAYREDDVYLGDVQDAVDRRGSYRATASVSSRSQPAYPDAFRGPAADHGYPPPGAPDPVAGARGGYAGLADDGRAITGGYPALSDGYAPDREWSQKNSAQGDWDQSDWSRGDWDTDGYDGGQSGGYGLNGNGYDQRGNDHRDADIRHDRAVTRYAEAQNGFDSRQNGFDSRRDRFDGRPDRFDAAGGYGPGGSGNGQAAHGRGGSSNGYGAPDDFARVPDDFAGGAYGYGQAPSAPAGAAYGYGEAPSAPAEAPYGYGRAPDDFAEVGYGYGQAPDGRAGAPYGYGEAAGDFAGSAGYQDRGGFSESAPSGPMLAAPDADVYPDSWQAGQDRRREAGRRGLAVSAVTGWLAAAAAIGVSMLAAAFVGPQASPILAVGKVFVDRTPAVLKNVAAAHFGGHDRAVLLLGMYAAIAVLALGIGLLARRAAALGVAGLVVLGLLSAFITITRPESRVTDVMPSVLGGVAGVAALLWLVHASAPVPALQRARGGGPRRAR